MGTNCAPVVAYVILFCYERDVMFSLFLTIIEQILLKHLILPQDI